MQRNPQRGTTPGTELSHPSLLHGDIPSCGLPSQRDLSAPGQAGIDPCQEEQEGMEKGTVLHQPELGPTLNAAALSL